MKRIVTLLLTVVFLSGCAGVQQRLVDRLVYGSGDDLPKYTFTPGTRVGIINLMDTRLTHKNFKMFSEKDTFVKKYDVDWNLPQFTEDFIGSVLQKDGRYELVSLLIPPSLKIYKDDGVISSLYNESLLSTFRDEVDSMAREHNLQVVIITGNHTLISNDNNIVATGYGLYTGRGFSDSLTKIFGDVYAFVGLGVQVYHTMPLTYIGGGRPSLPYVAEIPWRDDIHNIPLADFDSIKPIIVGETQSITMRALQQAQLVKQ